MLGNKEDKLASCDLTIANYVIFVSFNQGYFLYIIAKLEFTRAKAHLVKTFYFFPLKLTKGEMYILISTQLMCLILPGI